MFLLILNLLTPNVFKFGSGRRVCLGRHVGILEIKKLLSFLVINYNVSTSSILQATDTWPSSCVGRLPLGLTDSTIAQIQIVDPEKFEVENSWFFFQKGLYARIQKRPKQTESSQVPT